MPPGKKRYHNKCRKLADAERRRKGTPAPGGRVCANPECSNKVSGKARTCSGKCRTAVYRLRKKRNE